MVLETRSLIDPRPSENVQLDPALAVFQAERQRLFRIAHRILGSVTETEDVIQDVWLRRPRVDHRAIDNSSAFLATVAGRATINVVQSATSRHEFTTASCPEQVDVAADPATRLERTETAEFIVRVLLERANPSEQAAYLLRRGFGYPYLGVAQVLHLGQANTRQLIRRAHFRIRPGPVNKDAHQRLVLTTDMRRGSLSPTRLPVRSSSEAVPAPFSRTKTSPT
ncbi:hypothetical protein Lesp02_75110 [Lentzea sp. NBRC 105346]|uniref:sigma factor n=1 Tax=Lentzea sp. NBRC 105346 TaxID=3032205 RepID=UPI0024A502BD|nr:sigma factor [Lentzea sp. NBRC 105346]GLZ35324.1 hypothetical protein Lesp02_75110 [Lentzea sp. NBRC 105346]